MNLHLLHLRLRQSALLALLYSASVGLAHGDTLSQNIQVSATVTAGCLLGASGASLGVINFGSNITNLANPIDVSSTVNAGSISLKCTPSTLVKVDIDSGLYASGGISAGRAIKHSTLSNTLKYQLYQDSGHATIWGNGTNGGSSQNVTADGTQQTLTVYARLLAQSNLPAAGQYSDTVVVTFTY